MHAHCLWRARGGTADNALNDWLQAESEVLTGFIHTRMLATRETHTRTTGKSSQPAWAVQPSWTIPPIPLTPTYEATKYQTKKNR